jgi:hypothetical protein
MVTGSTTPCLQSGGASLVERRLYLACGEEVLPDSLVGRLFIAAVSCCRFAAALGRVQRRPPHDAKRGTVVTEAKWARHSKRYEAGTGARQRATKSELGDMRDCPAVTRASTSTGIDLRDVREPCRSTPRGCSQLVRRWWMPTVQGAVYSIGLRWDTSVVLVLMTRSG